MEPLYAEGSSTIPSIWTALLTLVVCPNLAIDRVLTTAAMRLGELARCHALLQQAGGKGANVLRALRVLRAVHGAPGTEQDLLLGCTAGELLDE